MGSNDYLNELEAIESDITQAGNQSPVAGFMRKVKTPAAPATLDELVEIEDQVTSAYEQARRDRGEEHGYLETIGKGLVRGAEGIAGGVGSIGHWAGEATGIEPLAKGGKWMSDYFEKAAREGWAAPDPVVFKGSFMDRPSLKRGVGIVSEALPSLVAALGVGTAAAAGLRGLGMAANAARNVGAAAGAFGLGALEGAPQYQEAREAGKTIGEASTLGAISTIGTGLLEFLPIADMLKPLAKGGLGKQLMRAVKYGGEEAAQEGMQNTLQQAVAKYGYDATRELTEGLAESIIGGFGAGAIAGTTSARINRWIDDRRKQGVPDAEISNDIDLLGDAVATAIEQKSDEIAQAPVTDEITTNAAAILNEAESPDVDPEDIITGREPESRILPAEELPAAMRGGFVPPMGIGPARPGPLTPQSELDLIRDELEAAAPVAAQVQPTETQPPVEGEQPPTAGITIEPEPKPPAPPAGPGIEIETPAEQATLAERSKIAGPKWDAADAKQREEIARALGWATAKGNLTPRGKSIVKTEWAKLSAAAQRLISTHIEATQPAPPQAETPAKEPWQMTLADFKKANPDFSRPEEYHHDQVRFAQQRKLEVPPEVLAEYPDLQPKEAPPQSESAETGKADFSMGWKKGTTKWNASGGPVEIFGDVKSGVMVHLARLKSGAAGWMVSDAQTGETLSGPDAIDDKMVAKQLAQRIIDQRGTQAQPEPTAPETPGLTIEEEGGTQTAPGENAAVEPVQPQDGWRENIIKARKYAKDLGLEFERGFQGMKLGQIVAAIDEHLAAEGKAPKTLEDALESFHGKRKFSVGAHVGTDTDASAFPKDATVLRETQQGELTDGAMLINPEAIGSKVADRLVKRLGINSQLKPDTKSVYEEFSKHNPEPAEYVGSYGDYVDERTGKAVNLPLAVYRSSKGVLLPFNDNKILWLKKNVPNFGLKIGHVEEPKKGGRRRPSMAEAGALITSGDKVVGAIMAVQMESDFPLEYGNLPRRTEATKGAADQIAEMSMEEIDKILDDEEKAAAPEEAGKETTTEAPEAAAEFVTGENLQRDDRVRFEDYPGQFIEGTFIGMSKGQFIIEENSSTRHYKNDDTLFQIISKAAAPEAAAEPQAEGITIETPTAGPRAPKGPRKQRTAAEIAESAAQHGVKGIGEAVSGLYELFGGKSLKSFPGSINEDTYAKAKPHFQKALEEFQAAGRDIKAFVKWAYDNFSTKIKPYLRRFIAEKKAETAPQETDEGIKIEEAGGDKKKRGPKLQDTGEALGGKRSSKDHRTRTDAIEIELGGSTDNVPAKQAVDALVKKTTRSTLFKIDHPVEGRTFGVKRFLNQLRTLTYTWHDRASYSFGRYRRESAITALERYAEYAKNLADMKASAAEYISVMEQLNDAVKYARTVAEARDGIVRAIVADSHLDKMQTPDSMKEYFSGNPASWFTNASVPLTDFGKALKNWVEKPYGFGDMLYNRFTSYQANEEDQTRNLPIVRQRRNIFEINTPDKYRENRDVSPDELLEAFGLRGLDFGEWVEADFRQRSVNLTYDSFKMLAESIGANDRGISLSDTMRLGIGWGARGQGGKTAAAFWPSNRVIGLTKTKGDGSLAHEWAHAFDHMTQPENMRATAGDGRSINAIDDLKNALRTFYKVEDLENRLIDKLRGVWSNARKRTERLREAKEYLKESALFDVQEDTKFFINARALDGGEKGKYYSKKEEMFARAFEAYVSDKLQGENTYLVDAAFVAPGAVEQLFNREHGAYPTEQERERFKQLFDDFFGQIEWSDDGIPRLKADYVPVTEIEKQRAQQYIDALYERVDAIYEALYGGEQSDDGLYWYAYEATGRGVAAQPKGYIAYDDSYQIETAETRYRAFENAMKDKYGLDEWISKMTAEEIDERKRLRADVRDASGKEQFSGIGAVAYSDPLKADDVLAYFLRPVKYVTTDSKITLEIPDGTTALDLGDYSPESVEALPPEDVQTPGGTGGTGTGGTTGAGAGSGGSVGLNGEGDDSGRGEGSGVPEVDPSAGGGGSADTATGLDAVQSTQRLNYTIRASNNLESTNPTERFNANIAAIRTLKQIESEGRMATAEEQDILVRYSGWGELSGALEYYASGRWTSRAALIKQLLTDEEIESARLSTVDAYYTPPTVGHLIYEGLNRLGFAGGKVLEPSSGIGHFFGTMPEEMRRNSVLTAVELDKITARIASQLYQSANVLSQPFEKTSLPDNFYDLSISNVPFGDTQIHDKKHNPAGFRIHDYFINKMLNVTKPGGLVVAITSTGTMDKLNSEVRKAFSEKADLISAIRLPNGIFPGAAAGADILFFRRKGEGLPILPKTADWVQSREIELPAVYDNGNAKGYNSKVPVNNFFAENPENVLGDLNAGTNRYGDSSAYVRRTPDVFTRLNAAIDRLPTSIYTTTLSPVVTDPASLIPEPDLIKDFSYYLGEDGKIYQNMGGTPKLQDGLNKDQTERLQAMMRLRTTIRKLLKSQALDQPERVTKQLRKRLNSEYDTFVKKHGALNERRNARLFIQDPDAGLILGLEHWDKGQQKVLKKAAIFYRNTIERTRPPESAETALDGLLYSLAWRGKVDLGYISTLTKKTRDTIISELQGRIFDDPERGWVTADEYLSGNVRNKLAVAKSAAALDERYKQNVEALEIVQPVDIPYYDIGVKLGAAWIPAGVVHRFVNDLFGYAGVEGFHLDHVVETGMWVPHFRGRNETQAGRNQSNAIDHTVSNSEFGTLYVNLFNQGNTRGILDYALNGGFPEVWIWDHDRKRNVKSIRHTDAAGAKLTALQTRFRSWVAEREDVQKQLEEVYNTRINNFVERKFDGSHLSMPGKVPDEIVKMRPHQKNAIWRALQSPSTYFAHEVGTGKTFTMIGTVMEARRLGLAKKPIMLLNKATVGQIAGEFLRLYPGANILVLRIPENADKRRRIFSRIATGDYDCVLINHDSFEQIPLAIETEEEFIQAEAHRLEAALREAQAAGAAKHTLRDIQRRIRKLGEKLRKLRDRERDLVPTMEEMGIDMVVVDEAHTHKNIGFQTKYSNLKGVEDGGSSIALDLFFKTQYLHKRFGRGIIMASGTPLTNSVGELYNISRYMHPADLDRLGVSTFDAWANTFGEMKKEAEYAPEGGGFKLTSRFSRFVNIPELMALTRQSMDIRTTEELGIKRPAIKNGKPTAIMMEQNEYVTAFQEVLKDRVAHIRMAGPLATFQGYNDNMLRVVSDGRKVAMDARLYEPTTGDYPETKTNAAVDLIYDLYGQEVDAIDLDPGSPNYGKPYKEKNHVQLVYADLGVPSKKKEFNIYEDLRKKLVRKGIPREQIVFIHEVTDSTRPDVFRRVNAGKIRVLIGSTKKMGIGVNVQERVSNMHHLDVDWTYANYEQRNGRGWRYGNRVVEVGIYNYGTKRTVDAFMWATVAYKEKVLKQVMSNDPKIRNVEDISKTSMEASEMEGLLADDPLHKEKIELEEEVRRLNNVRSEFYAAKRRASDRLARIPLEILAADSKFENNHAHLQIAESINALQVGDRAFSLETEGQKATDAVIAILGKERAGSTIGRFGRIVTVETAVVEKDKSGKEIEKIVKSKRFLPMVGWLEDNRFLITDEVVTYKIGKDLSYDYQSISTNGVSRGLTNIRHGLEANRKEAFSKANSLREEKPRLEKVIDTPWDQEQELTQKEQRLRQITEELLSRQEEEDARRRSRISETAAPAQSPAAPVIEPEDEEDDGEVRLSVGTATPESIRRRGLGAQRGNVERIQQLVPVVERALRTAGLPREVIDLVRVDLKPVIDLQGKDIEQTLSDWAKEGKKMSQVLGATTVRRWSALMELSLEQDLHSLEKTAYHEAFHIAARWLLPESDYNRIMQRYQTEEGAAEAFADFVSRRSGGQPAPVGALRRAFLTLRTILQQVGDFLRGKGWTNPEDIFGALVRGEYEPHYEAWGQGETTTALSASAAGETRAKLGRKPAAESSILDEVLPEHARERSKKAFAGVDGRVLDKIRAGISEFVTTFTPGREHIAMDPRAFGQAYEILRNFKATKQYADRKALDNLREILDPKTMGKRDYELFTLKIALEDLARELGEGGKYENWEAMVEKYGSLQFGFRSADEVGAALQAANRLVDKNPVVQRALERRDEITTTLLERVVDAGLLKPEVLKDRRYFHHQVLEHLNDKLTTGTGAGAFRIGKRGYQYGRVENVKDYSLAYIESEFEVMAHQISQIEKKKNLDEMKAAYDIAKELRDEARRRNYVEVVGGQENMDRINHLRGLIAEMRGNSEGLDSGEKAQLKEWAEEIRELDPTMPYRTKIAVGYSMLSKALGLNVDEADVDDYAIDMKEIAEHANSTDEALSIPARSIFKAIGERNQFIKETLGARFLTEADLMRDRAPIAGSKGWAEWVPNPRSAFYLTGSISDSVAQQIMAGSRELQESDIHQVLARGRDETWIVPQELAEALESRQFYNMPHETVVSRVAEKTLNAWKRWVLINPMRIVKYNLNNTSGDFDIAFAYDPKILKYAKQAAADLWSWHYDKEMPPALKAELDKALRDEVIGSGMTVHDIPDVRNQAGLQTLMEAMGAGKHSALSAISKFWESSKNFTTWRENVLRLAAYRHFKAELAARKRVYGASTPEKVDAISDRDRKAALLSRELIGDYGALSQGGQWLRRKLIPFYSWMEINAPRYWRLFANLAVEGEPRGRALRMGAVAAAKGGLLTAKVFAMYAAAQLFNHLFWPDEEEELGETGRRQAHVILGRREDGSVITLRLQGALSDALSWFNLHDFPHDIYDLATGKKSAGKFIAEGAAEPINKLAQGIRPEIKAPAELASGRTVYPEFWRPRPIRDRAEYVASLLSADTLYRRAAGRPLRGDTVEERVLSDLLSVFTYSSDPQEIAYYKARDLVHEYLADNNLERPIADPTTRTNALFYYKQALKYGDAKAAEKYLHQYKSLGGDLRGIKLSVQRAHPLGSLPTSHRARFFNSLDADERRTVQRATKWYRDTF